MSQFGSKLSEWFKTVIIKPAVELPCCQALKQMIGMWKPEVKGQPVKE
jgi:hypothetical protein